jgi:hypothetical protein
MKLCQYFVPVAIAFAALTPSAPASALTYVGSYWVGSGDTWTNNPPVYTPQEAAALIFGGTASQYAISISSSYVSYTGWEDGWGNTSHLKTDWYQSSGTSSGTPVAENYSLTLGTGYNDPFGGPAFSAYVADHDSAYTTASSPDASINYVFAVPETSTWAMLLLGFAGLGFMACRRESRKGATASAT